MARALRDPLTRRLFRHLSAGATEACAPLCCEGAEPPGIVCCNAFSNYGWTEECLSPESAVPLFDTSGTVSTTSDVVVDPGSNPQPEIFGWSTTLPTDEGFESDPPRTSPCHLCVRGSSYDWDASQLSSCGYPRGEARSTVGVDNDPGAPNQTIDPDPGPLGDAVLSNAPQEIQAVGSYLSFFLTLAGFTCAPGDGSLEWGAWKRETSLYPLPPTSVFVDVDLFLGLYAIRLNNRDNGWIIGLEGSASVLPDSFSLSVRSHIRAPTNDPNFEISGGYQADLSMSFTMRDFAECS